MPAGPTIHTTGHSSHTTEAFLGLLRQYGVTAVVDVRSQPYSQWTPQYNRETLIRALDSAGIIYQFVGGTLGGRPSDPSLYNPGGKRPDCSRGEQMRGYRAGIDCLLELAESHEVAMMCSEGDRRQCHRHLLIAQSLLNRGVNVVHIQPDGTMVEAKQKPRQLSLLG